MRHDHLKVLFCTQAHAVPELGGQRIRRIAEAVENEGHAVVRASSAEGAMLEIRGDAAIGCFVLDWDLESGRAEHESLIHAIRERGIEAPIFILTERHRLEEIDVVLLERLTGYVFLDEDTPEFIARNLVGHLEQYGESLRTPFLGAMMDYAEQGNQMWTCPGHNGGIFYRRSPVGRQFFEHLGEAVFRNDLDNSVVELGDLLVHQGPALAAQEAAAEIFGADRTYFVLNGTSTSNKVVESALVKRGDLVLFDRNNHKSNHHGALVMGGGIPVYLETARNAQGLIGPIEHDALDEHRIRETIRNNPLIDDESAWQRERPFRLAVIEQCTYDGTIYDIETLVRRIGPLCDYLLFDEAWAGFMKFHPLFEGRFAMGAVLGPNDPGIIATQSTHKQLAGFSQASQIHVKDAHLEGQRRRVEHRRFNEAFMLHASTSPFYPLFASLDVGAQMMKGRAGTVLWDDTIRTGIELRKKIRQVRNRSLADETDPARRWFFEPFVPDVLTIDDPDHPAGFREVPWEEVPTDVLASEQRCWAMGPDDTWHGFGSLERGYVMTDPNKLTLLTPGFERTTGRYADHGIPAPILAQYLRENHVVPEKNDLNSILFLLTPGLESSKAGTLLSALVEFKRLHDDDVPLERVIPAFVRRHEQRYRGVGLRALCAEMHRFHREHETSALQAAQFRAEHFPEIALSPQEANERLVANEVDFLPIDGIDNRIAATMALVYPPGIGVVVPGERYDDHAKPMLDYFRMFEENTNRFPGFETEIQGVYPQTEEDGTVRLYTYVVAESGK